MPTVPLAGPLFDYWRAAPGGSDVSVAHNPATGEPLGAYRNATPEDVATAVEKATIAFRTWGRTTPAERAALLLTVADRLEAAGEDFARAEGANVGKPLTLAREEIAYDADVLRFMAGAARVSHAGAAGEYVSGSTSMTRRDPLGVVGLITPWNYPLMEAMWKVAPALAAGNTVVLKPSELTPLSTILFAQLAQEVLPDGVLNLVLGNGTTGAALVEHPAVRLVSLTGDVSTGKKVAAAAAATLKRVHLELGGKAPALVFADAPLDAVAAELAATGFLNAGQDCTAPCRVIVEDAAYDTFVEAYCKAVADLRCGDPDDKLSHFGPVISLRQLERVEGFVDRARSAGAAVQVGGRRIDRSGWFYEATVITGVQQNDEIIQREVFGPVVTIQRAGSDDEMLAMANGVDYGLAASIWTKDVDRSLRFTRDLSFGTVWLNQHLVLANEMPFGGIGQSGYGKELSAHAIDEYSQVKHVMLKAAS
ncbi:aminobutyraldehyde dehydrogenase [Streptomyces phaeochromogenes]|uniref:aminobutyraldehyde dehydrogenase n=1 Tax=Streptomyces phaeochromogenes TaxID=1923 RepID=UPI0038682AC2|nr:aminobutyraldehyde dehydrogenase [Streptomyces phaeochromogenes]